MHWTQVATSPQWVSVLVQLPPSMPGQVPRFHPIEASVSLSPVVAQFSSGPPQRFAIALCSWVPALLIAVVALASGQGPGLLPVTHGVLALAKRAQLGATEFGAGTRDLALAADRLGGGRGHGNVHQQQHGAEPSEGTSQGTNDGSCRRGEGSHGVLLTRPRSFFRTAMGTRSITTTT